MLAARRHGAAADEAVERDDLCADEAARDVAVNLPRCELGGNDAGWRARAAEAVYRARVAGLGLSRTFEPAEMVASLIVTGWLLEGEPGGLAVELDERDEAAIVDAIGRLAGFGAT